MSLGHSPHSTGNTRHRPELAPRATLTDTRGALGSLPHGGGTDRIPQPNAPAAGRGATGRLAAGRSPEPRGGSRESHGQPRLVGYISLGLAVPPGKLVLLLYCAFRQGMAAGKSIPTCPMRTPRDTARGAGRRVRTSEAWASPGLPTRLIAQVASGIYFSFTVERITCAPSPPIDPTQPTPTRSCSQTDSPRRNLNSN